MASTLFFLHSGPSPSSSSSPKPLPTTLILTKNLITHYRCGHSHTTTTRETIQTHNLDRWFRLSTWNTQPRSQTQTTTKSDPSSCPQCTARLASELRQAADRQRVIRLNAERASWKEGRRNPAPPTRGVQETIDAVLSVQHEECVERLRKVQEKAVRGVSTAASFKSKSPSGDDGNDIDPWERQRVLGMVAQKKLDAVARGAGGDSLSGEGTVLSDRPTDTTKSTHTRRILSSETQSLASTDEPKEQVQTSPPHPENQSLSGENLSIDLSIVQNTADDSPPQLEKDRADYAARISPIPTADKNPEHHTSARRNKIPQRPVAEVGSQHRQRSSISFPVWGDEVDLADFKLIYEFSAIEEEEEEES